MEFRILGPLEVWDGGGEVSLGGPQAACAARRAPPPPQRGRSRRPADRRALGRGLARGRRRRTAGQRLATSQGASAGRADDQIARLRHPGRARRARSPPLRAPGGRGEELARSRPGSRRVGAAPRRAVAVEGPGARGLRLRELRPGGDRPARGDQAGSGRAPDRRRPRARAPRRAGRRARGTRRRAPAPRAPAEVSDDGAVPVGSAGGGPGRLPGCAPGARRRARDRSEPGAPGAGAGDPPAGPVAGPRSAGARGCPGGRGAVDPRRHHATRRASTRCSRWPSRSCDTRLAS